jgi:hypothetical protein
MFSQEKAEADGTSNIVAVLVFLQVSCRIFVYIHGSSLDLVGQSLRVFPLAVGLQCLPDLVV